MLACFSLRTAHAGTVYIHPSSAWQISSWRYFKGTQEPPANWRERDFDDSAWSSGKAPLRFEVQLATRDGEWRDVDATVDTEEIASGDNHRIHRIMFSQVQEARHARILLWGTNPHVKQYGGRYTPTEFLVIAAQPAKDGKPPNRSAR
ncbi:MAG: hypothetical protein Q7S40_27735 [Opitutaceae bacterium]|nr:hypothetical protein [Opitutaceae bacterium]